VQLLFSQAARLLLPCRNCCCRSKRGVEIPLHAADVAAAAVGPEAVHDVDIYRGVVAWHAGELQGAAVGARGAR
jgi:hypothetical protein